MAALVVGDGFNIGGLAVSLEGSLPVYARPLFVRIRPEMEITGTFKLRKVELVKEGFDPNVIADPLYVFDSATQQYVPLDEKRYTEITSGQMRF